MQVYLPSFINMDVMNLLSTVVASGDIYHVRPIKAYLNRTIYVCMYKFSGNEYSINYLRNEGANKS